MGYRMDLGEFHVFHTGFLYLLVVNELENNLKFVFLSAVSSPFVLLNLFCIPIILTRIPSSVNSSITAQSYAANCFL